jgi:SSS family solute:Na+ symporter/sodium/pantothenate symporter
MAFLPLLMTLLAVTVGIITLAHFPGLSTIQSDRALMVISREIQSSSQVGYWVVVVLFAALLAAIMSTADSALLSIASMISKDIYAGIINKTVSEQQLTRMGKGISWIVVTIIVILAITLREKATIVSLLDRKFDLLVQLVPAFFLGIRWQRLRTRPTLYGLLVGLTIAIVLAATGHGKPFNIHAGLWALTLNAAIAIVGSLLYNHKEETSS